MLNNQDAPGRGQDFCTQKSQKLQGASTTGFNLGKFLAGRTPPPPDCADMLRLYSLILSRDGHRANAIQKGIDAHGKPLLYYSEFFDTDEDLARSLGHHGQAANVWHSTATFRDLGTNPGPKAKGKNWRARKNVHSRQCFHGDIDCGSGKDYPGFAAGKDALLASCAALSLPLPIVVCSGTGVHFYWPLTAPIADMNVWWAYAKGLLTALTAQGLVLDAKCSCDAARILRPPGTLNHKQAPPLPVSVDDWGVGPVPLSTFARFKSNIPLVHRPHLQQFSRLEDSKLTSALRQIPVTGVPRELQGMLVDWAEYFDPYSMWTNVGGAIRATYGDAGFDVFDDWSSGDLAKYDGTEATRTKYEKLTFDRLTVHKIYQLAAAIERARAWIAEPLSDAPGHVAVRRAARCVSGDASIKEAGL